MKRFIYIITILLAIVMFGMVQMYVESNIENEHHNFVAEGKHFMICEDNVHKPFIPNGVTLTATQPGVIPSGNEVSYKTYQQWFGLMQEMGLNTVKVDALMPTKFYRALRDYNLKTTDPLYLVQGIYFDEVALKDGASPMKPEWKAEFAEDIEAAINAVHGHASLFDSLYLFSTDPVDVSDWLFSYVIGVNWAADDIAYSNALYETGPYSGDYFCSVEEANPFESFLAEMLDYAASYEITYYTQESLYALQAHGNQLIESLTDGDGSDEAYDRIRQYPVINAEHITTTEDLKTGLYVSYDIEQADLDYLVAYHNIPVAVSAYGIPSGRFTAEYSINEPFPYTDEVRQAERTAEQYLNVRNTGAAGQFLRDWQDAWFKSSWYTADLKIPDNSILWRDVQTYGQGFGLIAFDPKGEQAHYLDGDTGEWQTFTAAATTDATSYKLESDTAAIHVLIETQVPTTSSAAYYIGIDVTPESGSKRIEGLDLTFERDVDFLVVLEPDGKQEILVQAYYDTNLFRLSEDMYKRYPDRYDMDAHTPVFNRIYQYSDQSALYYRFKALDADDLRLTGSLSYGNSNPASEDYLSAADWYQKDGTIELRLPYGLLNFMSPAGKMILDDFYDHHTFRMKEIDGLYFEFTETLSDETLYTEPCFYTWDDWTSPEFEQRIKPVYQALQQVMKGE